MKSLILASVLMSFNLWAKPVVLVSYYDSFNKAPFNNSEKVAKLLEASFKTEQNNFDIKLCALETVFDKAYGQLEACLKNTSGIIMVLGLGESNCDFKVETMMRNLDQTFGPDNAGNNREKTAIIPEAGKALGLRYPLPQMYCALTKNERKDIEVSNNAGSFVCNNTSFQLSYHYPEIQSGFIHVPSHHCKKLEEKTQKSVENLRLMIKAAVSFLEIETDIPHKRLPVFKSELNILREESKDDTCQQEYFKRSRGIDEKRSLWIF